MLLLESLTGLEEIHSHLVRQPQQPECKSFTEVFAIADAQYIIEISELQSKPQQERVRSLDFLRVRTFRHDECQGLPKFMTGSCHENELLRQASLALLYRH